MMICPDLTALTANDTDSGSERGRECARESKSKRESKRAYL